MMFKPGNERGFHMKRVFGPHATSQEVYEVAAKPVVKATMEGTVFAYGVTSSGKTHTMHGDQNAPGIIPLAIKDVISIIQDTPGQEFLLRVSYLEIYNEVSVDGKQFSITSPVRRICVFWFITDVTDGWVVAFYRNEDLTPYSKAKLPITSDVPEGCVIIREHVPISNLFTCLWFHEVDRFTSRDQISFSTVRDKIAAKTNWTVKGTTLSFRDFLKLMCTWRSTSLSPEPNFMCLFVFPLMPMYQSEPISWFQKKIRQDMAILIDHISKEMNELNLIWCQKIPKRPGADWHDLLDDKACDTVHAKYVNMDDSCLLGYTCVLEGLHCFGEKLWEQVEERLEFYDKGVAPRKNIDVMKSAIESSQSKDVEMEEAQPDEASAKQEKEIKN
ncbi:hypothetical protein CRYUN_Cryun28dG0029200 [Craigia yunnanensis]